jgi:RNA 2',3'-cyclic 3'-phosphodiesterase
MVLGRLTNAAVIALKRERIITTPALSSGQIRSFISIDLEDGKILSQVESIMSSLLSQGADLKPVERENIHLTLKFLGNISATKLGEIKSALAGVTFPPFSLEIKGAGAFPSPKRMNVIWVGIGEGWSQVELIFEQTEKLLHQLGFSRETRPFSPHITVARVKSGWKRDEIAAFLGHLAEESFGTFTAESVRLKQSILSPSGPRYSTLFEVPALK